MVEAKSGLRCVVPQVLKFDKSPYIVASLAKPEGRRSSLLGQEGFWPTILRQHQN